MEQVVNFFNKYGVIIITLLTIFMFFRTCNLNSKYSKLEKKIEQMDTSLVILSEKVITEKDVREVYEDAMWNFLELEELADKKNISITQLKHNKGGVLKEVK